MKLLDTRIDMAGKFRCCASLGASPEGPDNSNLEVKIGDKLTCYCCKQTYILRDIGKDFPHWEEYNE